jgi:hypothetical protein
LHNGQQDGIYMSCQSAGIILHDATRATAGLHLSPVT